MTAPSPGSREAKAAGCRCATIDNHYGRGWEIDGKRCFVMSGDCPLHGLHTWESEEAADEHAD